MNHDRTSIAGSSDPNAPTRAHSRTSRLGLLVAVLALTCLGLGVSGAQSDLVVGGALLRDGMGLYPRVVRLEHQPNAADNGRVLAVVVVPPGGESAQMPVFESRDDGKTFSNAPVGVVRDDDFVTGLCCIALFELPQTLGDLEAGTLLAGASVGQNAIGSRRMALRVYASTDLGRTWAYRSTCVEADNEGGLWEPEFVVAIDGSLTCHFSDETEQPTHSQFLAVSVSTDGGKTWGQKRKTVASSDPRLRPGMSTVRRLPNGKYAMTYEVCGVDNCAAFIRFSADGLDWGDPTDLGSRVMANTGRFPAHTPVLAWTPGPGPEGRLLLSFQMYFETPLQESALMGRTLLVNPTGGEGPWLEVSSPLTLNGIRDHWCPNYSSPVLPSTDGARWLLIATNFEGSACKPYFASAAIPTRYAAPSTAKGEGNGQLRYTGSWTRRANPDEHASNVKDSGVTLRFYGTRARAVGARAPENGVASFAVDGQVLARADLYAAARQADQTLFETAALPLGWHTLTVRVAGERRTGARASNVVVSRFEFE